MRKFLFVIALVAASTISQAATGIMTGYCTRSTAGADDVMLVGLGQNSTAATCFHGVDGFFDTVGMPVPYAATVNKLYAVGAYDDSGTTPATFNVLVELYVNGVASGLSCTVVLTGGTTTPEPVTCNNTSTVITVAAGDYISAKMSSPGIHAASGAATSPALALNVAFNVNKL